MIVNEYFLEFFLNPITGMADDDEMVEKFRKIDTDNPEEIKRIIVEYLQPKVANYPEDMAQIAKDSLGYFLANDVIDFERAYESCLPPFDPPNNDYRLFFQLLWDVLYGSDFNGYMGKTVEIRDDFQEPQNRFYRLQL